MLKSFIFLLRFFIFWIIFFFIERLIFLIYFSKKLAGVPFKEILNTFLYGLRMDASMAGYISAIPLLAFLTFWIFPKLVRKSSVFKVYSYTLIALFSLISVISFNIYREWGTKINSRAIGIFFTSTNEAVASASSSPLLSSVSILFTVILISILIAKKLFNTTFPSTNLPVWQKVLTGLIFLGLNFLAIRGGLDAAPINQSMAYFSHRPVLNHAAINTEWNLIQDLIKTDHRKNPYSYYPATEASTIVQELYPVPEEKNAINIFNLTKPNVVFIILESFTADVVASLGGEKGVAPNLEKLISEGLSFNHIYASGDRTDKGLIAILSAFPSQAINSIIKLNNKQEKLPAISSALKNNGYQTSFYYGGQSEFFNIKSYLLSHGYDRMIDKSNFEDKNLSSWGVFDHLVFKKNVSDLDSEKQPFFSTILTLSNHEPFQLPGKAHYSGSGVENKFRSTAYYTDQSLGDYINEAQNKAWYKNTVFVIVADHGHRLPRNSYESYDPGRFRIPLLFFGDALKPEFRGRVIEKTGNQTDIAATLLNQLGVLHGQFKWSRDLLKAGQPGFSFFSWDNGFGFATKEQTISFDNVSQKIIFRKDPAYLKADSTSTRYGKAYMQEVYQTFLDY